MAQSLDNLAGVLFLKCKQVNVDSLYLRALAIRKRVYGPENPVVVVSLNDLGVAYTEEGKFPEAERTFSDALTITAKQPKPDGPTLAKVYANMANLYQHEGKDKKARKMAEKAKALRALEESPS